MLAIRRPGLIWPSPGHRGWQRFLCHSQSLPPVWTAARVPAINLLPCGEEEVKESMPLLFRISQKSHHFCLHIIGQNFLTWPHLTQRDLGMHCVNWCPASNGQLQEPQSLHTMWDWEWPCDVCSLCELYNVKESAQTLPEGYSYCDIQTKICQAMMIYCIVLYSNLINYSSGPDSRHPCWSWCCVGHSLADSVTLEKWGAPSLDSS